MNSQQPRMATAHPLPSPPSRADAQSARVWLLSPYHTGSHKAWADAYARHSRHHIQLLTMAGRFWKWRMQGGAMALAALARAELAAGHVPDVILATDMVNLPAWLGLLRRELPTAIPLVYYMHENQLTYPPRPGTKPDLTYPMFNWLSQLAADRVLFNSRYHHDSWFGEVPKLLKHFPDYNHLHLIDEVCAKSSVLPVGIECDRITAQFTKLRYECPLILWNQRWEYDKRPDRFFNLLYRLRNAGIAFRLAVAGENFRQVPAEFDEAQERLADVIDHWGYAESTADYVRLLQQADLVISTADHEFFGISVLEAIVAGAFPLLPQRLSYPELIPPALHPACLYQDEDDLFAKAEQRLTQPRTAPPSLRQHVRENFDWRAVAARYDALVDSVVGSGG